MILMSKLYLSKKRKLLLAATTIIAIIATSTFILSNTGPEARAALIQPYQAGRVGFWSFDEGSGTTAHDSSANNNDGMVNGATWVTGVNGQALSFNGLNNYVSKTAPMGIPTGNAPITVSAWVKVNDVNTRQIFVMYGTYASNQAIILEISSSNLRFHFWDQGLVQASTPTIITDTWFYVVGVYDGVKNHLYVNGIEQGSAPYSSANLGNSKLFIGDYTPSGLPTSGIIDEVCIYNRALSASEIQSNFQNSAGFSSQLTANIPKGTTQVITTLTWEGTGSINATITSPSQTFTEDILPVYQKTSYSTSDGSSNMLNIKRLLIAVNALPADQSWNITLAVEKVISYKISIEVQK
jgi:hypothetical protein